MAIPSIASAQWKWGREERPEAGVCFYKDPDFEGDYFCARPGESESSMPSHMNDKISSIRIFGNISVQVFQDSKFEGRSTRFDFDVPNLKHEGWDDLISSFRVSEGYGHSHMSWGHQNTGFHEDPDVIVKRAYEDVLGREPDPQGLHVYRSHIIDDGWTEQQVRETLRRSDEYRQLNTMTLGTAQQVVRQAYLNVLRREPDAQGSRGYVNAVLAKRMTQSDVERELRKSDEYRRSH
jgi:hypothetical protein